MNNYLIPPASSQTPVKSKFKEGDRVRWLKTYPVGYNYSGTVVAVYPELDIIEVQFDKFTAGNYAVFEHEVEHIQETSSSSTQPLATHDGHEIVDNEVLGKTFKFCRHCRTEV